MTAYYNEIEPYAVGWLSNLTTAGLIPAGVVDGRDIRTVTSGDVREHNQVHFFAGIGGWAYALELAGWPAEAPVWTGSCPCQPFSAAGRKKGFGDERHLWPEWFRLIRECRPPVVFGEQVAGPDGLKWLDLVSADLEREGYAFGAADLCAACVGAPHIRQRLYFVAVASEQRRQGLRVHLQPWRSRAASAEAARSSSAGRMALTELLGGGPGRPGQAGGSAALELDRYGPAGLLGDAGSAGSQVGPLEDDGRRALRVEGSAAGEAGVVRGDWSPADLIWCQDGKYRPAEPGSFPLADGVSARVGKLRAYGNAIVPQVAATFVRAAAEAIGG